MIISGEAFFPVSLHCFLFYNPINNLLDLFTSIYYPPLEIVGKLINVDEN